MYCPKCGNEQAADNVKFCVRCGLPLSGAAMMLSAGGRGLQTGEVRRLSRRARGVVQGLAIVPAALGTWLVLDIFYESVLSAGMLGGLYAMFTLIVLVALARILYAIFYQGPATQPPGYSSEHLESHLKLPAGGTNTLPTPNLSDIYGPAIVPPAGEYAPPHSVTDSTTRKLKK